MSGAARRGVARRAPEQRSASGSSMATRAVCQRGRCADEGAVCVPRASSGRASGSLHPFPSTCHLPRPMSISVIAWHMPRRRTRLRSSVVVSLAGAAEAEEGGGGGGGGGGSGRGGACWADAADPAAAVR